MICKLIGAAIGFKVYPPLGAVVGLIFGHAFDLGIQVKLQKRRARAYAKAVATARFNQSFIRSAFGMYAKLVADKGGLNADEKTVLERIIKENLRFNRQTRKMAIGAFNEALKSGRSFQSYAVEFVELAQADSNLIGFMIETLLALALADGQLTPEERRMLMVASSIMGIPTQEPEPDKAQSNQQQQRQAEQPLERQTPRKTPYDVLGCLPSDSDKEIRKRFLQLVQDYHPDKIQSKDLPEDFIKFANEKLTAINAAYDAIKVERGIK